MMIETDSASCSQSIAKDGLLNNGFRVVPYPVIGCGSGPGKEVAELEGLHKGGHPCIGSLDEAELEYYFQFCGLPLGVFFGHGQELRKEYSFNKYNHCIGT